MSGKEEARAPAARLRFIPDVPAGDDFFRSHTRIAGAIVSAIEANPEIKVVGLLGRWGSGKSTVAEKVIESLEARDGDVFRVFLYDAWMHQSDPLRRSFLEEMILRLWRRGVLGQRWVRRLKKLSTPIEDTRTIETPELSKDAKWFALSLLPVPIGLGLIGFDTLDAAFGKEATLLGRWSLGFGVFLTVMPALIAACVYLWRRPWRTAFSLGVRRWEFWRDLDEDGAPRETFQLFTDAQSRSTKTRTFRSVEPTSLEFGREFQRAMRAVQEAGHRLVIVIDNLDRVAEDEALAMWATIRSFFHTADDTEDGRHEPVHPTVILPIDRHAVEALFSGTDQANKAQGKERARSFMDKTFDVTFEVTEPVRSDWREFLQTQMKWMFQDAYQDSWGFWTRRLFESRLERLQALVGETAPRPSAVTPREINKLLNRIGALYLQWSRSNIPVEVMALYVIRRDEIDCGLLEFLQSADAEIEDVAPDWARQLAALHYGVEPEVAGQVLLGEPIRQAILRSDEAAVPGLAAVPGFGETLEFITEALPEPPTTGTPFTVLSHAVFILAAAKPSGEQWAVNAWRNLIARFIVLAPSASPPAKLLPAVDLLGPHVEAEARQAFMDAAASLFERQLAQTPATAAEATIIRTGAEALIGLAERNGTPLPIFTLALDSEPFLKRLSALSGSPVWRRLRTDGDGAALGAAIATMLATNDAQKLVPPVVRLFTLTGGADLCEGSIDFEVIAETAERLVRDPGSMGGDMTSGLKVLADLSFGGFTQGEARLRALADDGVLNVRLDEAISAEAWDNAALVAALLVWRGEAIKAPSIGWWNYASRDPSHPRRIVAALRYYFADDLVPLLWGSHAAAYSNQTFVEPLISHAVEADVLGDFDPVPVFARLPQYKLAVPYKLREAFLDQLHKRADLLASIGNAPIGEPMAEAVAYLTRRGGEDAVKAAEMMRERVRKATTEQWTEAIRLGREPLDLGRKLIGDPSFRFDGKSPLQEALKITTVLVVRSGGREMHNHWFDLLGLLGSRQSKALQIGLGEALEGKDPKQVLKIVMRGGKDFLKAAFSKVPDRAVRALILPLLDQKAGRDWLRDNQDYAASWVARASPAALEDLTGGLKTLKKSKVDERRYTATFLAERWSLSI
ncbi:P-loop NTPase fold protein [Brevundimonas sp.]|uniref:P-loop NTPase fold protein n=1 Tax=Brevundimonas sp. TaxID=1871086 RepID=UPI002620D9B8|nr:P-loop NTPase fold protein [Brevundimonas sp.]